MITTYILAASMALHAQEARVEESIPQEPGSRGIPFGIQEASPRPPRLPQRIGVSESLYTLDAPPPGFDGKARPLLKPGQGMEGWTNIHGDATEWTLDENGFIHATIDNAVSVMEFGDCQLHVEYSLPRTPGRIGSAAASSGVIIHGRYEIELHNSFGRPPQPTSSGSVRGLAAPIVNAALPAPGWQALDIYFKAPRIKDGKVVSLPKITALLNGVLILNNVEISGPTDVAVGKDMPEVGPVILQGSSDPVYFRNLWIRRP